MNELNDAPAFIAYLYETSMRLYQEQRMDEDAAQEMSDQLIEKVIDEWQGQTVYVGKFLQRTLHNRALEIREQFRGNNHEELAKKHGISVVWVYALLRKTETNKIGRRSGQADLF